jgi:hypothetical protein
MPRLKPWLTSETTATAPVIKNATARALACLRDNGNGTRDRECYGQGLGLPQRQQRLGV